MQATLNAQELRTAISALSKCVLKDNSRPILRFIHVKSLSDCELLLEALDGFMLLQIRIKANVAEQGEMLLPVDIKIPSRAVIAEISGDLFEHAIDIVGHMRVAGRTGLESGAQYFDTSRAIRTKADTDLQIILSAKLLSRFAQAAVQAGAMYLTLSVPAKPIEAVLAEASAPDKRPGSINGLIQPVRPEGYR